MKRKHGLLIADLEMAVVGPVLLVVGAVVTFTPLAGGFFLATLGGFILLGSMAPHRTRHRIGDPVAFGIGLLIIGVGMYLPHAGIGRFSEVVLLVGSMLAFAGFFLGKEKEQPEVLAWELYRTPTGEEAEAAAAGRRRWGAAWSRRSPQDPDRRPASPGEWLFPPEEEPGPTAEGGTAQDLEHDPDPDPET